MRFFLMAAAILSAAAQPTAHAEGATLTVSVEHIATPRGAVFIGLYREGEWRADKPDQGVTAQVRGASITGRFENLPPGRYAVKVFQDLNGDGKLGRGAFGLPTEPFGFSNDAPVLLGPPAFAAAAFDVGAGNVSQVIHLH